MVLDNSHLKAFWETRQVKELNVHPWRTFGAEKRFAKVFTKLQAIEHTEFAKI